MIIFFYILVKLNVQGYGAVAEKEKRPRIRRALEKQES